LQGEVLNRVYWFAFNGNPLEDGRDEFLIGSTYTFLARADGFCIADPESNNRENAPMMMEKTVWPSKAGK
jgi:hypothetical protein